MELNKYYIRQENSTNAINDLLQHLDLAFKLSLFHK